MQSNLIYNVDEKRVFYAYILLEIQNKWTHTHAHTVYMCVCVCVCVYKVKEWGKKIGRKNRRGTFNGPAVVFVSTLWQPESIIYQDHKLLEEEKKTVQMGGGGSEGDQGRVVWGRRGQGHWCQGGDDEEDELIRTWGEHGGGGNEGRRKEKRMVFYTDGVFNQSWVLKRGKNLDHIPWF